MHRHLPLALTTAAALLTGLPAAAHAAVKPLTATRAADLVEREVRSEYGDLGTTALAKCSRTGKLSYRCRYVVFDGFECGFSGDGYRGTARVSRNQYGTDVRLARPRLIDCSASLPRP